jgi:hypothetical protein
MSRSFMLAYVDDEGEGRGWRWWRYITEEERL